MAVITLNEIKDRIKNMIGDDTSDSALQFAEDVSDTFDSISNSNNEDWKAKYEQNDKEWREKYRNRFFSSEAKEEDLIAPPAEENKTYSFDDLFKKG